MQDEGPDFTFINKMDRASKILLRLCRNWKMFLTFAHIRELVIGTDGDFKAYTTGVRQMYYSPVVSIATIISSTKVVL